jgi:hypothetical protein
VVDSVNHAWAVLKGRRMGDANEAESFLNRFTPAERMSRNRNESKIRVRLKKRKRGLGDPVRRKALGES